MRGGRAGVLLIHGLTGTPSEMRFVGKGLHRAGFTVYGMKLAGHCGTEADLVATGWKDWCASVDAAAERFRSEVDHMFVAGLSMGALHALQLALDRPRDVSGLALYGSTLRYDGWNIPWFARFSFLLPAVLSVGIGKDKRFFERPPYGIKDERIRRRIADNMISGDSVAAGLLGNPWPSLAQFHAFSRRVRTQLPRITTPTLILHSSDDDIASSGNAFEIARRLGGPVELELLADSHHMITVDRERDRVVALSCEFFRRIMQATTASKANIDQHRPGAEGEGQPA